MNNYLESFNDEIQKFFKDISYNSFMIYEKTKNSFSSLTNVKITLSKFVQFKEHFSANKEKNSKEIKSCIHDCMKKILKENGLLSALSASIFDSTYLTQIIEIIIKYYTMNINDIFNLIQSSFKDYIEAIIHEIETKKNIISINYYNNQSIQWKKLGSIYTEKRKSIYIDLENICNK